MNRNIQDFLHDTELPRVLSAVWVFMGNLATSYIGRLSLCWLRVLRALSRGLLVAMRRKLSLQVKHEPLQTLLVFEECLWDC